MTVVIDGTRTQRLVKLGDGPDAWQRAREITYLIESAQGDQVAAHLALDPDRACVVRCRRGPKGGWNDLSYMDGTLGYGAGKFYVMISRGWQLHLGWMASHTATQASDYFSHVMDAARYTALNRRGPQAFRDALKSFSESTPTGKTVKFRRYPLD